MKLMRLMFCALFAAAAAYAGDDGKDVKDVAASQDSYGPWHFDVKGLFLQRDTLAGNQALVYQDNGDGTFTVAKTTDDVQMDNKFAGTGEIIMGYDLNNTDSVEAAYFGFGTLRWSNNTEILSPGGNMSVFIPDITNDFDDCERVTIRQRSRLNHSAEISYKKELPDVCKNLDVFGGFRYVNLDESLEIRAYDGNNEGRYSIQTGNNLVGLQIGGDWSYDLCDQVAIQFTGKAGGYANFCDQHNVLVDNNGDTTVRGFEADKVVPAFVGETGLTLVFFLDDAKAFRLSAGYQALYMAGLSMAQDQLNLNGQIGPVGTDTNELATNGSVIFHGVVAGVSFPWFGEWDLPQSLNN